MRKIALIIVGLFMSLVASASTLDEITTDANGTSVNLASIVFDKKCALFGCYTNNTISKKLIGKNFVDATVFDGKGNLTNDHQYFRYLTTVKNKNEADNIVTIKPIAIDIQGQKRAFVKYFPRDSDTWIAVNNSSIENPKKDSGGMAAANITGSMAGSGFSNSAAVGAGAAVMLLADGSPTADFIYCINIEYKDKTKNTLFVKMSYTSTNDAAGTMERMIRDAR